MSSVAKLQVVRAKEHESIKCDDASTNALLLQAVKNKGSGAKSLGLHSGNQGLAPGNFIGAVWLDSDNRIPLVVLPKFPEMDYLRMYFQCIANRKPAHKCISMWPTQPLIRTQEHQLPSNLLVASFMQALNRLCSRHFRSHFQPRTANLSGKIKGRVRIHLQMQRNLARGRPDRAWCTYQTIQQDILENRVLRAALEQSVKQLQQSKGGLDSEDIQQLWKWIRACRTALAHVPVTAVSRPQLRRLRTTGAFTHYRQALALARFILLSVGVDSPRSDDDTSKRSPATPPFAIHSAELFEQYAQTVLKSEKQFSDIQPGQEIPSADENENAPAHPDYWVSRQGGGPAILDIKYKKNEKHDRADLYQVVAYSQHKNLCSELGCETQEPDLYLVYPRLDDNEKPAIKEIAKITAFSIAIKRISIRCPQKSRPE